MESPQRQLPVSRHIVVGVSDPSDDPARHRVFEVRAVYRLDAEGWVADVGEQSQNAQRRDWPAYIGRDRPFPTAAACLGHAVEVIVTTVEREAAAGAPTKTIDSPTHRGASGRHPL